MSPYSFGILFHHHFLVASGCGEGSGACLPTLLAFCSIIISWFLLVPGRVLGLVSLVFWHSVPSSFPAQPGFRSLFPYLSLLSCVRKGILFHHDLLAGSFWFLLGFRGLSPYFSFFLSQETVYVMLHHDFLVSSGSGLGFRGLSNFFSLVSFLRNGVTNEFFIAHERRGNMVCCCLGSMLVDFFLIFVPL